MKRSDVELDHVLFAESRGDPHDQFRVITRALAGIDPGGVDAGGSVEVFDSEDAARKRMEYIQGLLGSDSPFGSEYDHVHGPVLLRVTGELTPDQAAAYQEALTTA